MSAREKELEAENARLRLVVDAAAPADDLERATSMWWCYACDRYLFETNGVLQQAAACLKCAPLRLAIAAHLAASNTPAIPQPAPDVQAALADALLLCVKWMPCAEVRSWPPGFRLRKEALAAADAALLLAGRKS